MSNGGYAAFPLHFSDFLRKVGYAVWLLLLLLALIFYRERAFFMDAGFQLFNLINEEAIQIYHYRLVTALPQIFPWILMKMGAPLWAVAMSFSAGYVLFYLLIYHLLVKYFRNEALGWVLLFLFTLVSLDTFYHIQSEFYLGLSLLLLAFGMVLHRPALLRSWQWLTLLPLLAAVAFSHKLTLIFFAFLSIFFWLTVRELRHWRYGLVLLIFGLLTIFKSVFFTNWYEAAKQADLKTNLTQYLPRLLDLPSNAIFFQRCVQFYYLLPLLLLAVSIFYFFKKKWVKLALVWSLSLGYLLLYNLSDPLAPYRFYSEVSYLPLSIFVTVPLLFDVAPALLADHYGSRWRKILPSLFIGILLLRVGSIVWNHRTFTCLLHWVEATTAQPGNRFLLPLESAPMDTVLMEWGVPFTAMHLSALHGSQQAKTLLILHDFQWYEDKMDCEDCFFSPFHKVLKNSELNPDYFNLKNGKYQILQAPKNDPMTQ